ARMVRQQPTNHIAARRLLAALTQRNFALPVGQPMRHTKRVWTAEFSPDAQRVLTASLDQHAAVWDAHDAKLLFGLTHSREVRLAHFSPDGSRIVTVAEDFQARLWNAATGSALGRPMAHTKKIHSAQFSPDGQRLLTASDDGMARLWD